MEQVSIDVWILIAKKLELSDLGDFFSVSRIHSRVANREEFWRFVCHKNYGDWNLGDFDQSTWKGIVRWITERRNFIKTMEFPYECYEGISFVIEEQTNCFYIRSPNRTTFYYENKFPTGARDGDVIIRTNSPTKLLFSFKYGVSTLSVPPQENCWPYKPVEYSQVDCFVFISTGFNDYQKTLQELSTESRMELSRKELTQQILSIEYNNYHHFSRVVLAQDIHRFILDRIDGDFAFIIY